MSEPALGRLHVLADLDLEVDGQIVRVRGDGADVTVSAPDAPGLARQLHVAAAALGASVTTYRRELRRLANGANRAGIRVEFVGRTGPLITIGRGTHVRVMGWLAGSPHVRVTPGRESVAALMALLSRRGADRRPE